LTLDVGTQVYDATVVELWILWSMPDTVKDKVMAFMGTNINGITRSLESVVDERTNAVWFRRYAARIKGGNPPWEIHSGGQSSVLGDLIAGETVSTDLALTAELSARYWVLAKDIKGLVSGAEPLP
jgi:hypothetical protein